ncbi:MAG: NUMOD4 domain-containing protein [Lewinella sp.]|uniref:NUMOD4 domain-containing protein n=1 Tax=Lewinella sp. TaxID=2004506 RepID=UPI003D6B2E24
MMSCDWKDVKGYEGKYQVSSDGQVKSLDRLIGHYSGYKRKHRGRLLRPGGSINHYLTVSLDRKTHRIHRLVAEAFIPNPAQKSTVNHRDFNKWNNHVSNLEWVTVQENVIHANKRYAHRKFKCNSIQKRIVKRLRDDVPINYIMELMNISERTVYRIFST